MKTNTILYASAFICAVLLALQPSIAVIKIAAIIGLVVSGISLIYNNWED